MNALWFDISLLLASVGLLLPHRESLGHERHSSFWFWNPEGRVEVLDAIDGGVLVRSLGLEQDVVWFDIFTCCPSAGSLLILHVCHAEHTLLVALAAGYLVYV